MININMKWIKTYEAKANQYRNEKLRKLKNHANRILPKVEQVQDILNTYVFNEEYNNMCDEYLIPHMVKTPSKHAQRSIHINNNEDNYQAFINLNMAVEKEIKYGSDYRGMCRLLNDYYNGEISEPIYDETRRENGVSVIDQYLISPSSGVMVNIRRINTCELAFRYQLSWAKMPGINLQYDAPVLVKENLTRKEVLEHLTKQSQIFSDSIKVHFKQFEDKFKKEYLPIIKDIVFNSGKPTYKQASVLKHYPMLVHMLGIDLDKIIQGSELDDMGFGD